MGGGEEAIEGIIKQETYTVEKHVWSDTDFEQMGWHDVYIRGCYLNVDHGELLLDIDYIFQWVTVHGPAGTRFENWVAPATMVFENAYNVCIKWSSTVSIFQLNGIERSEEQSWEDGTKTWLWTLDGISGGTGSLRAAGYKMYVRCTPTLNGQYLDYVERSGISFACEFSG